MFPNAKYEGTYFESGNSNSHPESGFREEVVKMRSLRYTAMSILAAAAISLSGPVFAESVAEPVQSAENEAVMSEAEEAASAENAAEEVKVTRIRFAADFEEIHKALLSAAPPYYLIEDYDIAYEADAAFDGGAPKAASNEAFAEETAIDSAAVGGYSETNVRTEGVDEADVVKTDGKYIYILQNHEDLVIVQADGSSMKAVSKIHAADADAWNNTGAREFFINGTMLHIIAEDTIENGQYYYSSGRKQTKILTYDISEPENPRLAGEMVQDGSYRQARMRDGMIYLFTEWMPDVADKIEDSRIRVSAGGQEIPAEHYCIPNILTDANYLVVSSMNPEKPYEASDSKVLISGASQLYVSGSGIYAINVDYNSSNAKTEIVKFTYENGSITGKAAGTLRGTVNDTFSIDEYNGYLRVLTTYTGSVRGEILGALADIFGFDYYDEDQWVRHNALYVLDENMNRVGILRDLAEGEEIKSARFFGDTAYFVTFRNTDPLFSADLTNPAAPKILGELKIPGFSAYLHPFGDDLLVGLGYDADEQTGITEGIKLSLFDLSDPADVKETGRTTIDRITWCPALEDYKAIFADAKRQYVGFFCEDRYLVYHLENGGFERVLLYDFFEDSLQGITDYSGMRGLYIGDTFYLAGGSYVIAFDMEDGFRKTEVLRLL